MTPEQKQRAEFIIKQWSRQWEKAEVGLAAVELLKEVVNESN